MKKETNVIMLGKINNFYKITYGGKTRYISAKYVKIYDDASFCRRTFGTSNSYIIEGFKKISMVRWRNRSFTLVHMDY
ncbi:MAG TPA: hypothetical protein VIM42_10800 [Clostridium sp.]